MTETVTWLHISDTHFCIDKHNWDSEEVFDCFFEDLERMRDEYQLYPDLIFFTGDVAYGHVENAGGLTLKSQYEEAKNLLKRILDIFPHIPTENIFIVPGNHDVNRNLISKSQTEWLESIRVNKQKDGSRIINELVKSKDLEWKRYMDRLDDFKGFLQESCYQHLLQDPDRLIYSIIRKVKGFEVGIAGLNSAWSSTGNEEKANLWLGSYQISDARNKLKKCKLSIVISHHPPNWLTDFEDITISRKIESTFNFYLHGHEHKEWVTPIENHYRIASGALYNGFGQKHGYNFVRLFPSENKGEVFFRTYNNGTWVPNIIGGKTNNEGIYTLKNLDRNESINKETTKHIEETTINDNSSTDRVIYYEEISKQIQEYFKENRIWMERVLYETGEMYKGSIFGNRISHFSYEKQCLAKKAIEALESEIKTNKEKKYCLLIDSGSTMYYLFLEICERIKILRNIQNSEDLEIWTQRVFIITNNLPGIQYLMKYCRRDFDEYADLLINCLLIPGEPLPVYAAVTGPVSLDFLKEENIRQIIRNKMDVEEGNYKIISLLTANYMVRHSDTKSTIRDSYCPVARKGGHFDLKIAFSKLSDEIYLISPLTKFSFATCEELNKVNGFYINEVNEPILAKMHPELVKYREIELIDEKSRGKCTYITTKRETNDLFCQFSDELLSRLATSYGKKKVIVSREFILEQSIRIKREEDSYKDHEITKEIPHSSLRDAYKKMKKDGYFIWDTAWITNPREKIEN